MAVLEYFFRLIITIEERMLREGCASAAVCMSTLKRFVNFPLCQIYKQFPSTEFLTRNQLQNWIWSLTIQIIWTFVKERLYIFFYGCSWNKFEGSICEKREKLGSDLAAMTLLLLLELQQTGNRPEFRESSNAATSLGFD